ncbi:MAG: hypothetical protein AAFQ05_02895 [Pseudomonadota bacterium]
MSDTINLSEFSERTRKLNELLATEGELKGGGGDGTSGGMERRIERLESDVADIKVTLARIEAKLDAKIDWRWMTALFSGLMIAILRHDILALLSASP